VPAMMNQKITGLGIPNVSQHQRALV
jgi:hypothetical protein